MTLPPGKFITFEGIEGGGKSTQVALATQWLRERGVELLVTREPGGTPLAENIRDLVLVPREEKLPPMAELLLMFAARAVHLHNLIEPALQAGQWVLCDRFTDATFAYQGSGRGIDPESIAVLERLVQAGRQPDLTLLLDLPVERGMQRVAQRGQQPDRFERERVDFFERVRHGYLRRAQSAAQRFRVIDASNEIDVVQAAIAAALQSVLVPGSPR
jgi:dTMP kinase